MPVYEPSYDEAYRHWKNRAKWDFESEFDYAQESLYVSREMEIMCPPRPESPPTELLTDYSLPDSFPPMGSSVSSADRPYISYVPEPEEKITVFHKLIYIVIYIIIRIAPTIFMLIFLDWLLS